jgi:hypothetical protein
MNQTGHMSKEEGLLQRGCTALYTALHYAQGCSRKSLSNFLRPCLSLPFAAHHPPECTCEWVTSLHEVNTEGCGTFVGAGWVQNISPDSPLQSQRRAGERRSADASSSHTSAFQMFLSKDL